MMTLASRYPLITNQQVWNSMYLIYDQKYLQIFSEEIEVFHIIPVPGAVIFWTLFMSAFFYLASNILQYFGMK